MERQNKTAADFQFFLKRFGKQRFWEGFYYFKFLEYPLVWNHLNLKQGEEYLDIGSGYSVFPLFALCNSEATVNIMDDNSMLQNIEEFYRSMLTRFDKKYLLGRRFFINIIKENIKFPFPDKSFDKISCISTIEHQRGNKDTEMMQQIYRVLKKGGKAAVTFPFNNGECRVEDGDFFQRKYNISEIKKRLVDASDLKVEKVIYFGERFIKIGQLYFRGKFKKIQCILPFFSFLLWRICHQYEGGFYNFHESEVDKSGVGVAFLLFSK